MTINHPIRRISKELDEAIRCFKDKAGMNYINASKQIAQSLKGKTRKIKIEW